MPHLGGLPASRGRGRIVIRRAGPVLLALVGLAIGLASPAGAFEKGLTASAYPMDKVGDRTIFPEMRTLGADFLVYGVAWSLVAPTRPARPADPNDPAYNWRQIDPVVREAQRHGIELVPQVGGTPSWANDGRTGSVFGLPANSFPLNTQDYASFLVAMSRRYPSMRRWIIYGEPAQFQSWFPQGVRGARQYARQLDHAYAALKRVSRRNIVIGGNAFCCGRDDASSTSAATWLNRLRLPNGRRPRLDVWGMNPYGSRPIDFSLDPQALGPQRHGRTRPAARPGLSWSPDPDLHRRVGSPDGTGQRRAALLLQPARAGAARQSGSARARGFLGSSRSRTSSCTNSGPGPTP